LDWSPDSKHLAFAAQIDGHSSDIYVYDIENSTIRRATKDIENVLRLEWSPKGDKILYENSIPGQIYIGASLHIADPYNPNAQDPSAIYAGLFWGSRWVSDSLYLVFATGDTSGGLFRIKLINIDTFKIRETWSYTAESFGVDTINERIILYTEPTASDDFGRQPEKGIYLLSYDGTYRKLADGFFMYFLDDIINSDFIGFSGQEVVHINPEGEIFEIRKSDSQETFLAPYPSPDRRWMFISDGTRIELYSENFEPINSWGVYKPTIVWNPNSTGAFIRTDEKIYYLSIPNGEPTLVDDCESGHCPYLEDFVWLP
jgi:hypothetical protein